MLIEDVLFLQPTNEAFLRVIDTALLQRLLSSNNSGDLALLSTFLQFHSVPSPLPLDVRTQPQPQRQPQPQLSH